MIDVQIFYSIRNDNSVIFFSSKEVAKIDSELYGDGKSLGHFTINVEGRAYIDEVVTLYEYLAELENKNKKTEEEIKAIIKLKSLI